MARTWYRGVAGAVLLILALVPMSGLGLSSEERVDFTFTDDTGEQIGLSNYEGRVVVLGFFTDCESAGQAQALWVERTVQAPYGPAGIQVIGVLRMETAPESVAEFTQSAQVSYPVLVDTEDTRSLRCPDSCAPLTMVIDQQMRLRYEASSGAEGQLVGAVDRLLRETKILNESTWGKIKELFK